MNKIGELLRKPISKEGALFNKRMLAEEAAKNGFKTYLCPRCQEEKIKDHKGIDGVIERKCNICMMAEQDNNAD